jgi:hypothetical protein
MRSGQATSGLFTDPAERTEWNHVTALAKGEQPLILSNFGAAPLLFPWLGRPVGAFLVAGVATVSEIVRENHEIEDASTVIIPTIPGLRDSIKGWPDTELRRAGSMSLTFKGTYFELYKKVAVMDAGGVVKVRAENASAPRS